MTPTDTWYRVSVPFAVGAVLVRDGRIVDSAPIFARFRGQPLTNLERWVVRLRGTIAVLPPDPGAL